MSQNFGDSLEGCSTAHHFGGGGVTECVCAVASNSSKAEEVGHAVLNVVIGAIQRMGRPSRFEDSQRMRPAGAQMSCQRFADILGQGKKTLSMGLRALDSQAPVSPVNIL